MQTAKFQTRGRVIDLLGREQIADAPAAISELLKNALDAGAAEVDIDYLSKHRCIVVSDKGLGMRQSDLLEKWLVLATESKRGALDEAWLEHATKDQLSRLKGLPPLGEKGIGRLAVAALGRAVLVWTRWGKGKDAQKSLLFVHWDLFRHPHIGLGDAPIPYLKFEDEPPKPSDIMGMLRTVNNSIEKAEDWQHKDVVVLRERILDDLRSGFEGAVDQLTKLPAGNGTTFVILGATDEFEESLRKAEHRSGVLDTPESLKTILAFCNPFVEKRRIEVQYLQDGVELKEDYAFWTKEDLKSADHQIELDITPEGFATGRVRRYHERFDYKYQCPDLPNRCSSPGPLSIVLGYVTGKQDTRLSDDTWNAFDSRLIRYGGLYIYRDDIRVMPYGRTDFDYAKFEERRSLNAGRYFFSHRRMFGAVSLSKTHNGALVEKAGREGFITNGAYRGFISHLINVFLDLADTYFGTEPVTPHRHPAKKKRGSLERLQEKAKKAKAEFKRTFSNWQRRLPVVKDEINRTFQSIETELKTVETATPKERVAKLERAMLLLDQSQSSCMHAISSLGTDVPALASLDRDETRSFESYQSERNSIETDTVRRLSNLGARCSQLMTKFTPAAKSDWADIKLRKTEQDLKQLIERHADEFSSIIKIVSAERAPAWVKSQLESLGAILDRSDYKESTDSAERVRLILEAISKQNMHYQDVLLPFWRSMTLQIEMIEEADGTEALLGDIYRRTEQLEIRTQTLSELAQLGQIIEGIDHEYKQLFYNADRLLKELAPYVKSEGEPRFKHLRICLESLENKQNLLSPLYQRRKNYGFTFLGADVGKFIDRLYSESRRHGTRIDFTEGFKELSFKDANQATLFAAVANLISNSLYWVGKSSAERRIHFQDYKGGFIVSDSGPGIVDRDQPRVFEAFFTRRPSGRGLGLYIARTNLEAAGFKIQLLVDRPNGALSGACFYIYQVSNE